MKVFISWSGEKSKTIALALNGWLPLVLQYVVPWFSPEDIKKGAPWFAKIQQGLNDAKAGIICLTAENRESPWILFESGAIARGVEGGPLATLLIDLQVRDVVGPLAQFNHTFAERDSIFKLVSDLNQNAVTKLDEGSLKVIFTALWPELEKAFIAAQKIPSPKVVPREPGEIMNELLETTRQMSTRLGTIENSVADLKIKTTDYYGLTDNSFYPPATKIPMGSGLASLINGPQNPATSYFDPLRGLRVHGNGTISGLPAMPVQSTPTPILDNPKPPDK